MKRAALRQDETGLKRPRRNTRGRIKERKGSRRVGGGGGEGTLRKTSQCWYLGVCPHIQQCGNQLSPRGWTSRRAEESDPPRPCENCCHGGGSTFPVVSGGVQRDKVQICTQRLRHSSHLTRKERRGGRIPPWWSCARPSNENARLQKLRRLIMYVLVTHNIQTIKNPNIFQVCYLKYPIRDLWF